MKYYFAPFGYYGPYDPEDEDGPYIEDGPYTFEQIHEFMVYDLEQFLEANPEDTYEDYLDTLGCMGEPHIFSYETGENLPFENILTRSDVASVMEKLQALRNPEHEHMEASYERK